MSKQSEKQIEKQQPGGNQYPEQSITRIFVSMGIAVGIVALLYALAKMFFNI